MAEKVLTRKQIERILGRGRKLLHALSRKPAIRRIADQAGYTEEEHKLGWALWLYLMGYQQAPPAAQPAPDAAYDAAVAKLDLWDGPAFERTRAALGRHHAPQAAYVFNNLNAGTGAESVGAVHAYVTRVVTLRDGTDKDRAATRAEDKAAANTLAARNIFNPEIEAYLRGLLAIATEGQPATPAPEPPPDEATPAYQAKAAEFDTWLTDWRRTLRNTVTRRDYLIQLGLASRRKKKDEEDGDES
jgi:hypothetical protein